MRLIVNADDYGLSLGVSRGILKGLKEGVLTETSAIVNADFFLDSAKMAVEEGITRMGFHSLLTVGTPVLSPAQVPSLVNEQGRFYSRDEFMKKKIDVREAKAELKAQLEKFFSTGLKLTHIDTHHGFMQKTDEFFQMFLELASEYQVPLRNEFSKEPEEISAPYITALKENNIKVVDMLYFNHGTPHHDMDSIMYFLNKALEKEYETVEIGCHPGYSDDYLRSISRLNDFREIELDIFLDKTLLNFLKEKEIAMIDYTEL